MNRDFDLTKLLPEHLTNTADGDLTAFLGLFEQELNTMFTLADQTALLKRVDDCPEEYLGYLEEMVGLAPMTAFLGSNRREVLKNIVSIWQLKGTYGAVRHFVGYALGVRWQDVRFTLLPKSPATPQPQPKISGAVTDMDQATKTISWQDTLTVDEEEVWAFDGTTWTQIPVSELNADSLTTWTGFTAGATERKLYIGSVNPWRLMQLHFAYSLGNTSWAGVLDTNFRVHIPGWWSKMNSVDLPEMDHWKRLAGFDEDGEAEFVSAYQDDTGQLLRYEYTACAGTKDGVCLSLTPGWGVREYESGEEPYSGTLVYRTFMTPSGNCYMWVPTVVDVRRHAADPNDYIGGTYRDDPMYWVCLEWRTDATATWPSTRPQLNRLALCDPTMNCGGSPEDDRLVGKIVTLSDPTGELPDVSYTVSGNDSNSLTTTEELDGDYLAALAAGSPILFSVTDSEETVCVVTVTKAGYPLHKVVEQRAYLERELQAKFLPPSVTLVVNLGVG